MKDGALDVQVRTGRFKGAGLDPREHDLDYDPELLVPCPRCLLRVGVRWGRLNRHVVTMPKGKEATIEADGVKHSPRGPDGYCVGSNQKAPSPRNTLPPAWTPAAPRVAYPSSSTGTAASTTSAP